MKGAETPCFLSGNSMMYLVKEGHSFKSGAHSTCEQKFYNNNSLNLNLSVITYH